MWCHELEVHWRAIVKKWYFSDLLQSIWPSHSPFHSFLFLQFKAYLFNIFSCNYNYISNSYSVTDSFWYLISKSFKIIILHLNHILSFPKKKLSTEVEEIIYIDVVYLMYSKSIILWFYLVFVETPLFILQFS
jgi:hypothetical protein